MHAEVIISGFGGQGILFGARLLAQAAMMENKAVVMYPSYGAEVRGGTAHASVIIDDNPIGSPLVSSPDTLIILNKPSLVRFAKLLQKDGLLLVNTSMIQEDINPISEQDSLGVCTEETIKSLSTLVDTKDRLKSATFSNGVKDFERDRRQKLIGIPATEIAEHVGNAKAANMVMLGQYLKQRPVMALQQVKNALVGMLRGKSQELIAVNEKALDEGFKYKKK